MLTANSRGHDVNGRQPRATENKRGYYNRHNTACIIDKPGRVGSETMKKGTPEQGLEGHNNPKINKRQAKEGADQQT